MDTGEGHFRSIEDQEHADKLMEEFRNHGGIFGVGEVVELRGSKFRVRKITKKDLILRLLPKEAEHNDN